jgi:putative phosphoesterase
MTGPLRGKINPTALMPVGIVADTHIPDRVSELHPAILATLRQAGVSQILHAGDIAVPRVLETLRQLAPVTAVRGNRDIFAGPLPLVEDLELGGVRVTLTHGHGGWIPYLRDKIKYFLDGYRLERYIPHLLAAGSHSQVIIYGHTHFPELIWREGKLLFNPGSASFGSAGNPLPSIGLLHIYPEGKFQAEIVRLYGYIIQDRQWIKKP